MSQEQNLGVSILIKGTTNRTATEFDGNFELEVDETNSILVFSFIGFDTVELPASAGMNVILQESAESLEEITWIGYSSKNCIYLFLESSKGKSPA